MGHIYPWYSSLQIPYRCYSIHRETVIASYYLIQLGYLSKINEQWEEIRLYISHPSIHFNRKQASSMKWLEIPFYVFHTEI